MEFTINEVVPGGSNRTEFGRVVVSPPSLMGPLKNRVTGKLYMCCNRAYLTEDAYKKHAAEKEVHDKPLDFGKFPKSEPEQAKRQTYNRAHKKLWTVRKRSCANDVMEEEPVSDENEKENALKSMADNRSTTVRNKDGKVCSLCNTRISYSNLHRHVQNCHVPGGIKCDYCSCTFLLNSTRLRHHTRAHGVVNHRNTGRNLKKTIVARAKKQLAASTTTTASELINGKSKKRKEFLCTFCGKDFRSRQRLSDHTNTHTGGRPHKCDICGFRFTHLSNLKRHKRTAHTSNTDFCSICDCGFANTKLLIRHNKAMHPNKLKIKKIRSPTRSPDKGTIERKVDCADNDLASSSKFQCPSANASGFYECPVCNKELSSAQTWRGHMLIHQNLKPYKCKHCGVSFRLQGTMSNHILTSHSGGPFKCKECTCRFKTEKCLYRHKSCYHSKAKTEAKSAQKELTTVKASTTERGSPRKSDTANVAGFKCNLCGTVVRLLADFESHKALHSGSIRTQCNLCLKKFTSVINLKHHKERAHGDPQIHVHNCAFCCCRYKGSQAVFQHLVTQHGMEKKDWDYKEKSIKPEARKRLQIKMCQFDPRQEVYSSGENASSVTVAGKSPSKIGKMGSEGKDESPVKGKTNNVRNECDICHARFKLYRNLSGHKKKAHGFGTYTCGLCPCRYYKLIWLKKHQLKMHGKVTLQEGSDQQQRVHQFKSTNEVKCNLCHFKFKTKATLLNHKKKSHMRSGKFKCGLCTCQFRTTKGLEVHLSVHHGQVGMRKRQEMEGSDPSVKQNSSESGLETTGEEKQHLGSVVSGSSAGRIHECSLCQMTFSSGGAVKKHQRTSHSGKFKCLKCTCKFATANGLLAHKRLHDVKRNSQVLRDNAEQDLEPSRPAEVVHQSKSRKKRVKCKLCSLSVTRDKIKAHVKTSHGSGSYACSFCTCVFEARQGLIRHRSVYHKISDTPNESRTKESEAQSESSSPVSKSKVNLNLLKIRSSSSSKSTLKKKRAVEKTLADARETGAIYPSKLPRHSNSKGVTVYKFKCDLCGIKFSNRIYLNRHQQKAHKSGGIPCEFCTCTFQTPIALAAHKRTYHQTDKPVTTKSDFKNASVPETSPENSTKSRTRTRGRNSSEYGKEQESIGSSPIKTTDNKSRSQANSRLQAEAAKVSESVCKSPSEKSNFLNHQCTWCQKSFPSAKMLDKHMLCHTRPEVCRKCLMRFRTKDEVSKHTKVAHDPSSQFQCSVCSCRFATGGGLKAHNTLIHKKQSASYNMNIEIVHEEQTEDDDNPFLQVHSSYSLANNGGEDCMEDDSEPIIQGIMGPYGNDEFRADDGELLDNGEEYEESEPIVQGIMQFDGTDVLYTEHPSTSEKKKSFSPKSRPMKCSQCDLTCYGPENLRQHMQSHNDEEENNAEDVGVSENNDESERNTTCGRCGITLQNDEELSHHLQNEHDGIYRCAYCPCTMNTETNLRLHFMKHHSG